MRLFPRMVLSMLMLAVFALSASSVHAASAGDLVKLPDDGDTSTVTDSAVYYIGDDGKRYVFPNAQTYFTWYENFDTVIEISQGELASFIIGGNITYRPGTRLIKITSVPDVYAVEPTGILRHIGSEAIAFALYGSDWSKRIDAVP